MLPIYGSFYGLNNNFKVVAKHYDDNIVHFDRSSFEGKSLSSGREYTIYLDPREGVTTVINIYISTPLKNDQFIKDDTEVNLNVWAFQGDQSLSKNVPPQADELLKIQKAALKSFPFKVKDLHYAS